MGVDGGDHLDILRLQPQAVSGNLRRHRGMTLTRRRAVSVYRDRAGWIDADRGRRQAAGAPACLGAFFRRQGQGDICHVGAGWLHPCRQANAKQPSLGLGGVAPGP